MRSAHFRVLSLFLLLSAKQAIAESKSVINVAFEDAIRSFDPRQSADANSQYIEDLVHCSLMNFDAEGNAIPGLLTKAPAWLNATTLELEIRPDVKFSDGSLVRAEDVIATYRSLMSNPSLRRSSAFDGVQSFELSKDGKILVALKKPDASFPTNLVIGILKAEDIAQIDKKTEANSPGLDPIRLRNCGSFRIDSQSINEIVLLPNEHAFAKPKIHRLNIKIVRNEKTRYAKLRAGELDIVQNGISRDTLRTLEKRNPHLRLIKKAGLKTTYLGFNMRDPVLQRREIREAISLALNSDEIIRIILNGLATPAKTILTPSSPYFAKDLAFPKHDAKAAEKLLDLAGYPRKENGIRLELSLKASTDVTRIAIAKAIASQMKRVGIKVVVEPMEWGRFKKDLDEGRIQMWSAQWIGFKDPDIYRFAFATSNFPPNGSNRTWYSNPKLDSLLEAGRETNDLSKRKSLYTDVQNILSQDLPYAFLWHEENFAVINKDLEGFELFADGRYSALKYAFFR